MLTLQHDELVFAFPELHADARLHIGFRRTLRIPDDNRAYPLPPGLGMFPLAHVDDYAARFPERWRRHGGVFLPMYQAEALWINFYSATSYAFAVKIAAGKVNAVSGKPWTEALDFDTQDYLVVPGQPWLDGFCVAKGKVRQFVAMPLGAGYTAEEQLTGAAEHGGLQIIVYPLKPERYQPPPPSRAGDGTSPASTIMFDAMEVGMAPGGLMEQDIYEDRHARDDWKTDTSSRCFVHLLDAGSYGAVTGHPPPSRPPSAADYTEAGLPWFAWYADLPALPGAKNLASLDSVAALGIKKGETPLPDNAPVDPQVVKLLATQAASVREGKF